MKFKVSES